MTKPDNQQLAQNIAHEIGHTLGMFHDFDTNRSTGYSSIPWFQRRGTCGPPKWESGEDNLIMNYGKPTKMAWSKCSNMDFSDYYQSQLAEKGVFCLEETE